MELLNENRTAPWCVLEDPYHFASHIDDDSEEAGCRIKTWKSGVRRGVDPSVNTELHGW